MMYFSIVAHALLNGAQSPCTRPYCASSQIQKLNASDVVSWPQSGASTTSVSIAWYGTPSGEKYPLAWILLYCSRKRCTYTPPATSSSLSTTLTVAEFWPVALNVSVAVPLVLSASWASATVTVCAVFQFAVVNVSD